VQECEQLRKLLKVTALLLLLNVALYATWLLNGNLQVAGNVVATGKGVFPDSLRAGPATFTGDCSASFGKWTVRDSARFNGGLTVGGQQIVKILRATATLNFDLTAVVSQDLTITVTGAADGDQVALGVPNGSLTADTAWFAWVSAANTVTVRAFRLAGTPNPASGTFEVTVYQ
jgi:hypothetical protein